MFSIIIPVHNEEALLATNISKLQSYLGNKQYEIIIANNGSQDRTLEIAQELAENNEFIKVVSVDGKRPGLAFKSAVKIAQGDFLISQDMDLSTDLGFIDNAVQLMDKHDIVVGSKQMGKQERSFLRKLPSAIFIILTNTLLGLRYVDYSMAAKAYKKDFVIDHLRKLDDGTSYVIELIYLAQKEHRKIVDIPVDCTDRRKSKFNIVVESFQRFNRLIGLFFFRVFSRGPGNF